VLPVRPARARFCGTSRASRRRRSGRGTLARHEERAHNGDGNRVRPVARSTKPTAGGSIGQRCDRGSASCEALMVEVLRAERREKLSATALCQQSPLRPMHRDDAAPAKLVAVVVARVGLPRSDDAPRPQREKASRMVASPRSRDAGDTGCAIQRGLPITPTVTATFDAIGRSSGLSCVARVSRVSGVPLVSRFRTRETRETPADPRWFRA
jgi:hypothetical protein